MLKSFFQWWSSELLALLPRALRDRRAADAICLSVGANTVVLRSTFDEEAPVLARWSISPGEVEGAPLAGDAQRSGPVRMRFESGKAVSRQVELPIATEENLGDVLGFEMERLTPFRREDVHWRYRIAGRDVREGRLVVDLLVAPRALVDPVLATLGLDGLEPVLAVAPGGEAEMELEFRPRGPDAPRSGWLVPALLVLNVLLLVGLAATVVARQNRTLESLAVEAAAATADAERADALRQRLDDLRATSTFVSTQRRTRTPAVILLEDLSERLSDGTWLTRLEMRAGEVHLHGVSTSASGLIALLDASEYLSGARFASPVVRDASSGRDRFHVAATIAAGEVGE